VCDLETSRMGAPYIYDISHLRVNAYSLNEFQINLSHEAWGNVYSNNDKDTNTIFNNFLDTFLKTFNASFPQKRTQLKQDNKN